jgi:hypothetical protein
MHHSALQNPNPRPLRYLTLLALGLSAAACATDAGTDPADAPAGGTAAEPGPGAVSLKPVDPKETASPNGPGGQRTFADPEEALAAIPEAMRPAVLLDTLKKKLLVPDVKTGGYAYFTDIVTVKPGEDKTFCTYVDGVADKVTYLHDTYGSQTTFGHHALMQYTTTPQKPGTRECPAVDDLSMQPGQILGGTGGEGTAAVVLPSNVVTEIPRGAQFVINHHWINTSDKAVEGQAEIITIPPESDKDLVIARVLSIAVTDFKVAPGTTGETSGECTLSKDATVLSMLGHEHEWGTHVKAESMGAAPKVIFDHDYDKDMISQPRTTDFALDKPLTFSAGDKLRMSCQWRNTSDVALTFPLEMCVLFGWQIGADKDEICYGGKWL